MARGRFVSKSLSTSKKRGALFAKHGVPCPHCGGSLAEFAQGLYLLAMAHADDFGRQDGDLFTLKLVVDPLSRRPDGAFIQALQALDQVGLVQWFSGPRGPIVQVVGFDEHQWGLHKRTKSKFPEFPGTSTEPPEVPAASAPPLEIPSEEKRREVKRREEERGAAARPARPSSNGQKPNVPQLAAMVLKEILPLGLKPDDLPEAVKERAAKLKLPYDGRSVHTAIASALGQGRKRGARA